MNHTITSETAYELDCRWMNHGQPDDGLRLVDYRISGNRHRTLLTVPGDDSAPTYERRNGHFEHISGPTLDDLTMQAEYDDDRETTASLLQF